MRQRTAYTVIIAEMIVIIFLIAVANAEPVTSRYTAMKVEGVDPYDSQAPLLLIDAEGHLYTTEDYDHNYSFKEGDIVRVRMEFSYIGNQYYRLDTVTVLYPRAERR